MVTPYIKDKLQNIKAGSPLVGTHIFMNDPYCSEAIARLGFDFVLIDADNTERSYTSLRNHLSALNNGGTPSLVRLTINEQSHIKRVLELGPDGVILPGINSATEAERIVSLCLFPPKGERRLCPLRAAGYGIGNAFAFSLELAARECRKMSVFLQLDSAEALRNIDVLAGVDGIDGFFISPGGLCDDDGIPNGVYGADSLSLIKNAALTIKQHNKPLGVSLYQAGSRALTFWRELGVTLAASGSDIGYVIKGAYENLAEISGSEPTR